MTDEKQSQQPQGLLQGFGGLDGIEPPRDVQPSSQTNLTTLINAGDEIIRKYADKFSKHFSFEESAIAYDRIYRKLRWQLLRDVHFTDDDLRAYIFTQTNLDSEDHIYSTIGAYTGALLQLLTERNREQGKETVFYINGNGRRFPHLFRFANNIDKLIVENFTGNFICSFIGGYRIVGRHSEAKQVICINITGNFTLYSIAKQNGITDQVIGVSIKGGFAASNIGELYGKVNHLVCIDIEGNGTLSQAGYKHGKINQVLGYGIKGNDAFKSVGTKGCVNKIIAIYIEGDHMCYLDGANANPNINPYTETHINQIFGAHLKGKYIFNGLDASESLISDYPVQQLVCPNAHVLNLPKHMNVKEIITGSQAESMYEQMLKEDHVEEIVALARSMQGKPEEDILRIADELYKLRPKVPEGFFGRKDRYEEKK